jgi:hypothetical protein
MVPVDGDGWHAYFLGFPRKKLHLPAPVMEKGGQVRVEGGKMGLQARQFHLQYWRKSGGPARERAATTEQSPYIS